MPAEQKYLRSPYRKAHGRACCAAEAFQKRKMGTIWGTVDANLVLCRDLDCQENADRHLALVRAAYERVTGNRWSKSDSEAYNENGITKLPADKIISAMETVTQRTSAKIRSFNYFVKEIVRLPDPRNRAWQKKLPILPPRDKDPGA